jgi:hypothetical protein
MVSDSARGIALWFLVITALLYGVVNTMSAVLDLFA